MNTQSVCRRQPADRTHCLCASPHYLARITPHRARLLTLIADYHTNATIAAELTIAVATAKREVEELRTLTGCGSKRELARWWTEHQPIWSAWLPRS